MVIPIPPVGEFTKVVNPKSVSNLTPLKWQTLKLLKIQTKQS